MGESGNVGDASVRDGSGRCVAVALVSFGVVCVPAVAASGFGVVCGLQNIGGCATAGPAVANLFHAVLLTTSISCWLYLSGLACLLML